MDIKKRSAKISANKIEAPSFKSSIESVPGQGFNGSNGMKGTDLSVKADLAALKKKPAKIETAVVPKKDEPSTADISSYKERIKKRLK